jgi:hypothetical protein
MVHKHQEIDDDYEEKVLVPQLLLFGFHRNSFFPVDFWVKNKKCVSPLLGLTHSAAQLIYSNKWDSRCQAQVPTKFLHSF